MVIFDTNILIELYRGNSLLKEIVLRMDSDVFYISSITAAEFIVGAKNKADINRINGQLEEYTLIPINAAITDIFIDIFKTYSLSHRPLPTHL